MSLLSIVMPTFNRGALLDAALSRVSEACAGLEAEVIVVNDSKTSRVSPRAGVRVIDNPGSGAAAARNCGANQASGDLLLFVDDDILLSAANVRRLIELHRERPGACFNPDWRYPEALLDKLDETSIGRFIRHVGQTEYRGWAPELPWASGRVFEVHRLASFCLSIERAVFQRVGGFDEVFKNQGMEDEELSARLRRAGVKLFIDSTHWVEHNEEDRVDLVNRLTRFKNGAYNRRRAVDQGLCEYRLEFSPLKKAAFRMLQPHIGVLLATASKVPNSRWCDAIYRLLANALFGTVMYAGYFLEDRGPLPPAALGWGRRGLSGTSNRL